MRYRKNMFVGYLFLSLLLCACGQTPSGAANQQGDSTQSVINNAAAKPTANLAADSAAIMQAFQKLKENEIFLKDLGLENEAEFFWNDDYHAIIRGDLDGDGTSDALLSFVIESRGGGNNGDGHYAVLLNKQQEWKYQCQLNAGGNWAARLIQLDEIKNEKIDGNLVGNKDESLPDIPVEYVFIDGALINSFTALHNDEGNDYDFLYVQEIVTPDYRVIPTIATLTAYQSLLGKGEVVQPEEQPDCGTHFDEGAYSELHYPNLVFELNNGTEAACDLVTLKGSGFRINTGKGTLTESTTLQEMEALFDENSRLSITEDDDGTLLAIPDGDGSDTQLHIRFDSDGTIVSVKFFVPC